MRTKCKDDRVLRLVGFVAASRVKRAAMEKQNVARRQRRRHFARDQGCVLRQVGTQEQRLIEAIAAELRPMGPGNQA